MAQTSLTVQSWQEREALRHELAQARKDLAEASGSLRHSLNPKERARDFIRERPLVSALSTLAAGAFAVKVLPSLLWRSKGSVFKRFTGELIRGAAGMALPLIAAKLTSRFQPRHPDDLVLTRRERLPSDF